jgi:hypothetical protein
MIKWGMPIEGHGEGLRIQSLTAEHVYGDDWQKRVEARSQTASQVLKDTNIKTQEKGIVSLISVVTDGREKRIGEFLEAIESNPRDVKLREEEALLSQSVALAILKEKGLNEAILLRGDVKEIESILPGDLKLIARGVRDVVTPIEIGARLDDMNFNIEQARETFDTPYEIQTIQATVTDLREWSRQNIHEKEDPRRTALNRILQMLNIRRQFLEKTNGNINTENVEVLRPPLPKMTPLGQETEGGIPGGSREYESPFKVSLPSFAEALIDGGQVRFDYSDLPDWARHLEISNPGLRTEAVSRECVRYKIHDMADKKDYFGDGNFEKMRLSTGFKMTEKELAVYFNREGQLAGQMMVQDLMVFYKKENGIKMLVFKVDEKNGITPTEFVTNRVMNLSLYVNEIALRLALYQKGKRKGEDDNSFLERITKQSNKWFDSALEFRKQHPGQTMKFPADVSFENKLAAYSMREFMFISLAFSQADRTRMFAPVPRAIQDPERYVIWMDQKLKRKVGADSKTGEVLDIKKMEWGHYKAETATRLQLWVQESMDIEEVLEKPLDGKKYIIQKIFDGDFVLGPESLCIGYMDILPVNVAGKKMTLSEALYEGKFFTVNGGDSDTMSPFRDAMEQGNDAFAYFKGEVPFPIGKSQMEIDEWVRKRNKILGLTRDINQNGLPVFTDTLRDPKVIESLIFGCFGIDQMSIAEGRPLLFCVDDDIRASNIESTVDAMRLMSDWAHPDEVKNVLEGKPKNANRPRIRPFVDEKESLRAKFLKQKAAKIRRDYNEARKRKKRRNEFNV